MIYRSKTSFLFLLIFVLPYFDIEAQNGTILRSLEINSNIINQTMKFSVYLPPSYSSGQDSFPVLYLLHGIFGDENSWLNRCSIHQAIDSLYDLNLIPELILIMPGGNNSYFINNYDSSYFFEDFFIQELIPHAESIFRISKDSLYRAIAGLSMGGFGAVILTAKYPDIFKTCISLSAAVRNKEMFNKLPQKKYESYFGNVFGPGLSNGARITSHWLDNSPYEIINSATAQQYKMINWYIDCGMQDFLFPANKAFHKHLLKLEIPHEYHMRIGSHNWEYWKAGFIQGLYFWADKMK